MIEFNTITEMIKAINQIHDPSNKCENIYRLHEMLLNPLPVIVDPLEELEEIKPLTIDLSKGKVIRDQLRSRKY